MCLFFILKDNIATISENDSGALTLTKSWRASEHSQAPQDSSVGNANKYLNYGIPAKITSVSLQGSDYIENFYVSDTGGQIFRFDVKELSTTGITGGRIAHLNGGDIAGNRRTGS